MIHATVYTSVVTSSAIKDVTCEQCGARFVYEMVRRSSTSSTALYGMGGSAQNAQTSARTALTRMLDQGEDLVACPACGHFQKSMLALNKTRYWNWSPWGHGPGINPNEFPEKRGHFPGTPTAFLLTPDVNPAAMFQRPPDVEAADILSIRVYQNELPPVCCRCLAPATDKVVLWPQAGLNPEIAIPCCSGCATLFKKRMRKRQGAFFATFFLLMFIPALALSLLVAGGEKDWYILPLMGLVFSAIGAAVLVAIFIDGNRARGVPVAIARMDWETLICRMRFGNLAYLDRIREHIAGLPLSETLLHYIAEQ